jgi:hypothetical protein
MAGFGLAQKKYFPKEAARMKTRELDEMLERFGRDGAVKAVSELARTATTLREALRYIRWLAELQGWMKPRRRVRQHRVTRACPK